MSDLLPPGNQPAPSAGDDPRQFPDFFASDMWPEMWPRMIQYYADSTARDAELAGLGPSDIAFAYLANLKLVTYWNGTAWAYLSPMSNAKVGKRLHWGVAAFNTTGSGTATITHGAGFTPTAVIVSSNDVTWRIIADTFTSTTFRVTTYNSSGTAINLSGVDISYVCGE